MAERGAPIRSSASATTVPGYRFEDLLRFEINFLEQGVVSGLAVSQNAGGANMSVDVAAGVALVRFTTTILSPNEETVAWYVNDLAKNVLIDAADATNPRIDRIIVKYNGVDPNGSWSNTITAQYLKGTAAGSPVAPTVPAGAFSLCQIAVAANAPNITNANLTDQRTYVTLDTAVLADIARATETAALRADSTTWLGTITGTDTLTGSATPAPTAYAAGQRFAFVVANTNAGAVTINVNGLGAKNLYGPRGSALVAGELVAGGLVSCRYDGTRFLMESPKLSTQGVAKVRCLVSSSADSTSVGTSSTAKADYDTTAAILANTVVAGDTLRIRAAGSRGGAGSPVLTIRLELGTRVLLTFVTGADNAETFLIDCEVTIRDATASGTVVAHGASHFVGSTAWTTPYSILASPSSSIDFTANQTLKLTAQFGASNASNTTKLTQFRVDHVSV